MYEYKAIITNIVDADIFDAEVDLGFNIKVNHRFRIRNFDAPETWRPRNKKEHGLQATNRAKKLLENKQVILISYKLGIYGRYIANIIIPPEINYAELMIKEGFSKREEY